MTISSLKVDRTNRLAIKRLKKDATITEIENYYSDVWVRFVPIIRQAHIAGGMSYNDAQGMAMAEMTGLRSLAVKKYHSIYVFDESVVDFVKNSEPNKNERAAMYDVALGIVKPYQDSGMVVHMEGEEDSILYTFTPSNKIYRDSFGKDEREGVGIFYRRFCKGEQADIGYIVVMKDGGIVGGDLVSDEIGAKEWRIFFNLCMYMSAFPEYVIDGAPPIKISGSRERSTTIRASKQMREVYRDGVSPHMRRGHFRFLTSERYKEKRFQAVYVKPTMVKGSAKTVIGEESEYASA